MYANQLGCHPLAHQMGGLFDDIYSSVKKIEQDFRHSGGVSTVLQKEANKAITNLATGLIASPTVQRTALEQAERSAIEASILKLQDERKKLMLAISNPAAFAKANPGRAMLYAGVAAAISFAAYKTFIK